MGSIVISLCSIEEKSKSYIVLEITGTHAVTHGWLTSC